MLFRVTLPLLCAFLLFVAQGSPTYAQTGSISCANTNSELICTMTVSGTTEKISAVLWTGIWGQVLRGGNQLRFTPGYGGNLCGSVFYITGRAYRFVGSENIAYTPIATASTTHTWDCSSSPPRTPTGGNDGGSQNTPTGENDGDSQTTSAGGNDGGSQTTSTEEDTGGSGTIAAETSTDGAKILLTVEPMAISEEAGATDVVVTATLDGLDGQVFDDDVVVPLTFDEDINGDGEANGDDKAAVLNVDYVASLRLLTIPPGQESGTTTITITPINDKKVEDDETIRLRLTRSYLNNQVTVQDAEGANVKLTVVPVDITLQDTGKDGASFFAADAAIDDQTYSVGTAITDLVLPEASDGELTYGISALPAGLSFDAATRTLLGTPSAATSGAVTIVYTATDEDGTTDTLTFTITVNEAPTPPVLVELDGIAATSQSIREDADEPVAVTLTISLRRSSRKDEAVALAIVSPTLGKTAKRDEDFTATLPETITIPAGTIKATAQMTVQPQDNTTADGDKAFAVQATSPTGHRALINIQIIDDDSATPDEGEDDGQAEDGGAATFAFASAVEDQAYTEGTAITELMLPEATDGQGAITYRVFDLPAGLTFDAATRTVSGTPTKATDGAVAVAYLAQDSAGRGIVLTFSITVNPALSFGDLFK